MMIMKRITLLCVAIAAVTSAVALDFTSNKIYYTITSESTVECGAYTGTDYGPVDVPATVNYNGKEYTVVGFGDGCFKDKSKISSVTMPETITYIGKESFYRCTSLGSINLPESLERIGENAFAGCTNLSTPIVIPPKMTRIEDGTFTLCYKIPSAEIHDGIDYIGSMAFDYCKAIKTLYIPNSVTTIGSSAFFGCESLTYIHLPEDLTEIPASMLQSCEKLTHILIPHTVISIGDHAFRNLPKIEEIVIPENVTHLGTSVFGYCKNLKRVIMLPSTPPALQLTKSGGTYSYALSDLGSFVKFYMKETAIDAYKATSGLHNWDEFKSKFDYKIPVESTLKYTTFYKEELTADFHVAAESNTKPFVATRYSNTNITLSSLDDGIVPQGTGVVIRNGKPGETYWYQIAEDQSLSFSGTNYMRGFCDESLLSPIENDGSINYILYNGEFCRFNNAGTLGMHKAYLQLPATAGNAKNISIQIEDSYASGILNMKQADDKAGYFNLNGLSTKRPLHGIYIKNGKKTILK